jgi:hypothetical protein
VQGFNYRESTGTDCCDTCYQSRYHLSRGLICGYTDEKIKPRNICCLFIAQDKPEEVEEKQGELF